MKRLLAAAALLAFALAGAASGGHARATGTVSSTRLVKDGHIRITLTVTTPVEVGRPLQGTFRVQNVSKQPRKIQLAYPESLWAVIRSADGTTYDTHKEMWGAGGAYPPVRLRPGEAVTRQLYAPYVRWSGPLRVTAGSYGEALPPVHVDVTAPEPAPSAKAALADVVASTGHLLDDCTPTRPGVAVVGQINAPEHLAPPLQARCSITLRRKDGFIRAQVLIVSPSDLRPVHVGSPYETLPFLGAGHNATAIAWLFVVTRNGAISVDSTTVESAKKARGGDKGWQWTTSGYRGPAGGTKCGHTGGGGGGPEGPYVEFVSACD